MALKNPKAKGSRNERRSRDILLETGAYVIKAGGSLGIFDLIAIYLDGKGQMIQVKSNRKPGRGEMAILKAFVAPVGWMKVLHVWKDRKNVEMTIIP